MWKAVREGEQWAMKVHKYIGPSRTASTILLDMHTDPTRFADHVAAGCEQRR